MFSVESGRRQLGRFADPLDWADWADWADLADLADWACGWASSPAGEQQQQYRAGSEAAAPQQNRVGDTERDPDTMRTFPDIGIDGNTGVPLSPDMIRTFHRSVKTEFSVKHLTKQQQQSSSTSANPAPLSSR